MKLVEKCMSKNYVYNGKILNLRVDDVMLPNGHISKREIIEHNGGVGIIPIIGDDVLLIRQFRYAYMEELIEIPAGKREKGEEVLEVAKRELMEETGAIANELIHLGKVYPTVGYSSEVIDLFIARDLTFHDQKLDEDEFLNVFRCNYYEAIEKIKTNEIKDAKTIIGLLRVGEYFDKETFGQPMR